MFFEAFPETFTHIHKKSFDTICKNALFEKFIKKQNKVNLQYLKKKKPWQANGRFVFSFSEKNSQFATYPVLSFNLVKHFQNSLKCL